MYDVRFWALSPNSTVPHNHGVQVCLVGKKKHLQQGGAYPKARYTVISLDFSFYCNLTIRNEETKFLLEV